MLLAALVQAGYRDLRDVPPTFVTKDLHRRAQQATISGAGYFNASATQALRQLGFPRAYLDFETVGFVIPELVGTRPYEQLPFQWSLHVERRPEDLKYFEYLAIESFGDFDALARSLIAALPSCGPIFAYNASFERRVLLRLPELVPLRACSLQAVAGRLIDLLPVTRQAYYHRDMKGSWSIKAVMPTIASELGCEHLGDVPDGDDAQQVFRELRNPDLAAPRVDKLREALLCYCEHDTWAMVRRFLCEE